MARRAKHNSRFQPTSLLAVLLILVILFISTGAYLYLKHAQAPAETHRLTTLEVQRARWAAEKPLGFRYVIQVDCPCPPALTRPFEVTDRAGTVAVDPPPGATPPAAITIDEVFDLAARALREADEVSVRYHPVYGFPASMNIDWTRADDDAIQVSVGEFIVLDR